MLTSKSLGIYYYKAASRLEAGLRFLIFFLLLGLCLSEGWAQVLIDMPMGLLSSCEVLINGDYRLGEVEASNLLWSAPRLAGVIALGRVESTSETAPFSVPDIHPMGGLTVESLGYNAPPDSESVNSFKISSNPTPDLNFGVLSISAFRIQDAGKGVRIMPAHASNRLWLSSTNQTPESEAVILKRPLRAMNMTEGVVDHFGESGAEELRRGVSIIVIKGSEVIDFAGGTPNDPNILETTLLLIPTENDSLFIKNWEEYSDYFLVSREFTPSDETLSRIQFEGYERGARVRYYDDTRWEIVPASEAVVYGAVLGAFALGATAWRKHGRRRSI